MSPLLTLTEHLPQLYVIESYMSELDSTLGLGVAKQEGKRTNAVAGGTEKKKKKRKRKTTTATADGEGRTKAGSAAPSDGAHGGERSSPFG